MVINGVALDEKRQAELEEICSRLGYFFRDMVLLNKALTHRSYANENPARGVKDNERLEFLGDSVLDLAVSRYLFFQGLEFNEGDLSRIRSQVVNEQSLAKLGREINLGSYLLLGKGEEATGGRDKNSLLANAFEALLAAIFIDSSFDILYEVTIRLMKPALDEAALAKTEADYKGLLQRRLKSMGAGSLQYRLIEETGRDHEKSFRTQVWIGDKPAGSGGGRTKKEAEQAAAKMTCQILDEQLIESGMPPEEAATHP
ncbi:MAG: ribonuclease III [Nitrospinae bacterium]|nr:ribonuclease III [Nitrospinota bacterium]